MRNVARYSSLCCLAVVLNFVSAPEAFGSGFAIFAQDAAATAQGAAVTAHLDTPAAVYYNPALINRLAGSRISAGGTMFSLQSKFNSPLDGSTHTTDHNTVFSPNVFITHRFSDSISAGLGIFTPFGLSTRWNDTWPGRYIATRSELKTVMVNPAVSVRLAPGISVAAGAAYIDVRATLDKHINLSSLGLPDASQRFRGDGTGFGFNLGGHADLGRGFLAGITYRSRIRIGLDGDVSHGLPVELPALAALFPQTKGTASLRLPAQATVGMAYTGFNTVEIEAGVRWEGWSSFKELRIDLAAPVAGFNSSVTPKDWKDSYAFMTGIRYRMNDRVSLMAGYLYSGNPVPDATFDPSIPDANIHLFTVGAEVRYKALKASLLYGYQRYLDRLKNNAVDDNPADGMVDPSTAANGSYRSRIHMVGVNLSCSF